MRAIVIHGAQDLRIEPQKAVADPGPGEVLVDVAMGGICGSDLHYYNHGGFGAVRLREPMVLGHEVSGRIAALGSDASDLSIGQLVAVSPSRPCRACQFCLRGQPNHCENMRFYGSAMPFPHIQGAFRQQLLAQASQCVPADGLSPEVAAMAEPLAVCLHALRQAGDLVGKTVLVTGCGPIGALTILAARRAGAERIIATDLSAFTLDVASQCGADVALNLAKDSDALTPFTAGKGQVDVHFECSGAPAALATGISALRPQGTLIQLGMGGDMTVPMQAITAKELTVRGSFRFHSEFATAVAMLQTGLIDVSPLITHQFDLDHAIEAFEMAKDRTQAMKVHIAFSETHRKPVV
ncbi:L-idonate 5-dehydrogenase [Cognatiyoonia koreensis]|uniref:L-idonate 5-dehydrogenase n=1 Tax=Cognatiyoonia koreensis TaxID=364200 RepID=A0A1I0QXU6_9RHOB|nr:L-idonate 5-dehydrogenase [Cognatiyoonia koreensis]SEW32654.1 L-idonate 5-dehydrogenase [Cognatiyoonia koreensis]